MVTLVLFQPAGLGPGEIEAVTERGVTLVNAAGLLVPPVVVTTTETVPIATPGGTGTTICELAFELGVAVTPPKVTALEPGDVPKLEPLIAMMSPTWPAPGERLLI